MKKVYIISRYSARNRRELRFNIQIVKHFCREVMREGKQPVAPHLYYTQFLDDNNPKERALGLEFGKQDLQSCHEYLIVIIDGIISNGMRGELVEISRTQKYNGRIITLTRKEAKKLLRAVRR